MNEKRRKRAETEEISGKKELYSTTVSTKNEESQRSKQQRWKCERNNLFLSSLWL